MPALRALAMSGFLGGTALLVGGIMLDHIAVALAGIGLWMGGAAVSVLAHRLH